MSRKWISILFFSLLFVVFGLVFLFSRLDPNEFKQSIIETVKRESGYEIVINGDFRWHFWPKVSILSKNMEFKANQAKEALLEAENLRIDVKLFPLFVKKLKIKSVVINNGVLNITEKSQSNSQSFHFTEHFLSNFNKIIFSDGLIIFQRGKEIFNVRRANFELNGAENNQFNLKSKGEINTNQRSFLFDSQSKLTFNSSLKMWKIVLNSFNYQLNSAFLNKKGMLGKLSGDFLFRFLPFQFSSNDFQFQINNDKIFGSFSIKDENQKTNYSMNLFAKTLDLSSFFYPNEIENETKIELEEIIMPITINKVPAENELYFLNDFLGDLNAKIDHLKIGNLQFDQVFADFSLQPGILSISDFHANFAEGFFQVKGNANLQDRDRAIIDLNGEISSLNLTDYFESLNSKYAKNILGTLFLKGNFQFSSFKKEKFLDDFNGDLDLTLENSDLKFIDFGQLLKSAMNQLVDDKKMNERLSHFNRFDSLKAKLAILPFGKIKISDLNANSKIFTLNGKGDYELINNAFDFLFDVNILADLSNQTEFAQFLQENTIPLHIFGNLEQIEYKFDLEKLFKLNLKEHLKEHLKNQTEKIRGFEQ